MTILLSVSALYIVIFGNIPLVGYLTVFDRYMIGMYLFVAFCVILHQITRRMREKQEEWPMREIYVRLLEVLGRIFALPIVVLSYFLMFRDSFEGSRGGAYSFISAVTILCVIGGL
jgi:hypothetical protein